MVFDDVMDPDQVMEGMNIMASTEENGSIDPAALFQDPMDHDVSMSPELERPAIRGSISKVPNGNGNRSDRSPSYKQDIKSVFPAKGPKSAVLPYSTNVTGLVYDVRMRFHVEPQAKPENGIHPEDPRRIYSIYSELVGAGLVDDPESPGLLGDIVLGRIPTRNATEEEICAVHTKRHYDWVNSLKTWTEDRLIEEAERMDSIYLSKSSGICALLSAGGAIEACRAIWKDQVKNALAIIRPPGHHAEHDCARGFCFFNNVPIAARACQKEFSKCRKVMILDWDVHHGNGVQEAFYDDPNVLYVSLHVHKDGNFYPSGDYGDHLHCGEGAGMGRNINIPWKTAGMTDGDYLYAFQQVIMPIAQDFDPDMIIVSAGFDAAEGDMLGLCHVTPAGYAHMTHALMSLANGKIAVCLEGGYNLRSIAVSGLAVTRTLLGEPPDRLASTDPTPSGVDTVQLVRRTQAKFWPCLYPKNPAEQLKDSGAVRMHDIIREWQKNSLFESHHMTPLFIARNKLSKSYENQVLATPNYTEDRPLLMIWHDPPDLKGDTHPRTQNLELHNTYLTDMVKTYIDWAVAQGLSVIDINIPRHLTSLEDDMEMKEELAAARAQSASELGSYVWENYVEVYDRPHIFLMGIGAAYASIVQMLSSHERIREQIGTEGKLFAIISDNDPLNAFKKPAVDDPMAERWYRASSLIFVAERHNVWARALLKPLSRRWGTLLQSPQNDAQSMLKHHKDEIFQEMEELTEPWRTASKQSLASSSPDELSVMQIEAPVVAVTEPELVGMQGPSTPTKLPPVGNFALSPSKSTPAGTARQ